MRMRGEAGGSRALWGLLLGAGLLALRADASLHGFGEDAPLYVWAQNTFDNFPPYFWNNLFATNLGGGEREGASDPTENVGGGAFPVCPTTESRGFQGVTCSPEGSVTDIDLSFSSLPPDTPRLKGSLWFPEAAPPIIALPNLQSLNLRGNLLNRTIPSELGFSPSLKRLILEGNRFTGPIPPQLCSLNLTCLNVGNNNLSGPIPPCFHSFPCVDFQGNALLNRTANDCKPQDVPVSSCDYVEALILAPPPPPAGPSSALSTGAVVGIVLGALLLVGLVLAATVLYVRWRRRRVREEKMRKLASDVESQISSRHFGSMTRFSEADLAKACGNFDADCILGEGGYAVVYKGRLEQGLEVAIKRIKKEKMKEGGELEFLSEVEVISRAAHRNLVQSVGFCVEPGQCLMLVLHYYCNGSVASRTYGKEGDPLSWEDRQRIAKGAADGIAYLHTDCNPRLIHRDIKAENVLLNETNEAAVADFGLATQLEEDQTHHQTDVKGTIGHIAPEYILSGRCSEKTDVYAFGVFLLELISGKNSTELGHCAEERDALIADWVADCLDRGELVDLVDADIAAETRKGETRAELEGLLQLALQCLRADPAERPDMNDVAFRLVPRGMQEQMGRWRQASALAPLMEDSAGIDPLQWELENAGLGDDTQGSSVLNSSGYGSVHSGSVLLSPSETMGPISSTGASVGNSSGTPNFSS